MIFLRAASLWTPAAPTTLAVSAVARAAAAAAPTAAAAARLAASSRPFSTKKPADPNAPAPASTADFSPLFQAAITEARSALAGSAASVSVGAGTANKSSESPLLPSADALLRSSMTQSARQAVFQARAAAAARLPIFGTGTIKASPRKLQHLALLLPSRTIDEAMRQMKHTLKRRGERVAALLHRARASISHNYGLNPDDFIIQQAWVGKASYLRRIRIHARGRFGVMHRPHSHIKILFGPRMPTPTPMEREREIMARKLRKRSLFVGVEDAKPIQWMHPPWSSKPWKYVKSPRWTSPDRALAKK
ncbi:ribosomal protein L22/L17 [Entophlyctis helioformis]|nr:ribosomal protein L22/L17 [Entophlyctis helioformis]